jgi:murein DD-endopeptidase MepM/ murein hydrolase activator NlpD
MALQNVINQVPLEQLSPILKKSLIRTKNNETVESITKPAIRTMSDTLTGTLNTFLQVQTFQNNISNFEQLETTKPSMGSALAPTNAYPVSSPPAVNDNTVGLVESITQLSIEIPKLTKSLQDLQMDVPSQLDGGVNQTGDMGKTRSRSPMGTFTKVALGAGAVAVGAYALSQTLPTSKEENLEPTPSPDTAEAAPPIALLEPAATAPTPTKAPSAAESAETKKTVANVTRVAASPATSRTTEQTKIAEQSFSSKFATFISNTLQNVGSFASAIGAAVGGAASYVGDAGGAFLEGAEMATGGVDAPYSFVQSTIGADRTQWDIYRNTLAQIESSGNYAAIGGDSDHYDGRYQLGADAKTDAGKILKLSIPHDPSSRARYRNDPALQEKAFAAFTYANHRYLMRNPKYKSASTERKLQILGYAHNQGMGGAENWLNTGVVGADGFGTKGTKYTDALAANFRNKGAYAKGTSTGNIFQAAREAAVAAFESITGGGGQLALPVGKARISSPYGMRKHPTTGKMALHKGLDYAIPQGTPVVASADGVVEFASSAGGYGYLVIINHGGGMKTRYGHLSSFLVSSGQRVTRGQPIARSGGKPGTPGAGTTSGPHLHFEVLKGGTAVNPISLLGGSAPTMSPDKGDHFTEQEAKRSKSGRQSASVTQFTTPRGILPQTTDATLNKKAKSKTVVIVQPPPKQQRSGPSIVAGGPPPRKGSTSSKPQGLYNWYFGMK